MSAITCPRCGGDNDADANYCKHCGYALPRTVAPSTIETWPNLRAIKRQPKPRAGKWFPILFISVVVLAFLSNIVVRVARHFPASMVPRAQLVLWVNEFNATCPVMIDSVTRLENAMVKSDSSIQYNLTVLNRVKENVPPGLISDALRPKAVTNVRTNPKLKPLRDFGTTLIYYYSDTTGAFLGEFTVAPKDYR